MFAVLGDIPFQVVGSPQALVESRAYDYAEHRVVQASPRLQWLADDLETIQLEMLLHRSFTNPAANLLLLEQTAVAHAALPLVYGDGDFRGYFVIVKIETLSRQLSGLGVPFALTVRLDLRECPVEFDPAAPPIPSFVPVGIVVAAVAGISNFGAGGNTGISAIVGPGVLSGPATATLRPDDVSALAIVRSVF